MKLLKTLFMITALGVAIGWANPGFADIFTDGLQIYLPFDGDAEDQAGDPNDGNEHNITYEQGKFGEAASFNGSSAYIQVPRINIGTNDFTVSFWFKTTDIDGYMLDARQYSGEIGYYLISYPTPQNGIYFGAKGGSELQVHADGYQDSEWHMATGVRDITSNSLLLYIDGILIDSVSGDPGDLKNPPIYLGRRYSSSTGSNYYSGLIDDFRLYDRALNANEVAALYAHNPVPIPGAVWLLCSGILGLMGIKRRINN